MTKRQTEIFVSNIGGLETILLWQCVYISASFKFSQALKVCQSKAPSCPTVCQEGQVRARKSDCRVCLLLVDSGGWATAVSGRLQGGPLQHGHPGQVGLGPRIYVEGHSPPRLTAFYCPNRYTKLENLACSQAVFCPFTFCR